MPLVLGLTRRAIRQQIKQTLQGGATQAPPVNKQASLQAQGGTQVKIQAD
jgi:hypothetical protein